MADARSTSPEALRILADGHFTLDAAWRFINLNAPAEDYFGRNAQELVGTDFWQHIGAPPGSPRHALFTDAVLRRAPVRFEAESPAEPSRWFELHLRPRDDGGLDVYCHDVSDRRRAAAALRESEARYAAIFDKAPFAVALTRLPEATIVEVNEAFLELFGYTRDEIVGKTSPELGIADAGSHREIAAALQQRGHVRRFECTRRTKSGEPRDLLLSVDPVTIGGAEFCVTTIEDITERRRAEEMARSTSRRFQVILDHAPVAIYVKDAQGRFVFGNRKLERFTGRSLEATMGTTDYDWSPREDADRWRANDLKVLGSGRVWEFEETGTDAEGRPYVNLSVKFPLTDESGAPVGVCGISTDISERKRAEAALRAGEERLRMALDAARMGTFDFRPLTGEITWGERTSRLWGILDGSQPFFEEALARLHPDDRERVRRAVESSLAPDATGDFEQQYRIAWPDGSVHWMHAKGRVDFEGEGHQRRGVRMVGIQMDITEAKRAEEALRVLNAELAEADRRKDEFIAVLSHELRNPLAPMRYALPILRSEPLSDPASRAVAVVDRQLEHLTQLVDDLLDVARITSGKIELRRQPVTLRAIVSAGIEAATPVMAAAPHTLTVAVADEEIWLNGDPARLVQVVTNLLDNSAKYTPRGGQVTVEARREDEFGVIRVRDTGIGLPEGALPIIFEMFGQLKGPARPQTGLGVGLAVAKRMVEMHGGTIEAHSAGPGQGTEVVVRLPVAGGPEGADRAERAPLASPAGRRLKVLVVDDNQDLLEMLALVIETAGHETRTAADGPAGLAMALDYRPHVVLLDLGLPSMGGLEVARELRRHPETAHARLVALTGWGQPEDRRLTRDAGFDHHLTKPADPAQVTELLAAYAGTAT